MKALDLVYDKAVEGIPGTSGMPGLGSVEDFAHGYMQGEKSLEEKVDSLIRFQIAKASTAGFVTGLGGVLTLPVAIPANLASVFYIQFQMITAIAYMGGYDVRDDRVKTFCYVCLCGDAASSVLKETGIKIGTQITKSMISRLSFEAIKKINRAVGFRLITKFGQKGAVNLGKTVPVVGGVIGGAIDGSTSYAVGKAAKRTFITGHPDDVVKEKKTGRLARIADKVNLPKRYRSHDTDSSDGEVFVDAKEVYVDDFSDRANREKREVF